MVSITGNNEMGMQLVAGDARQCAGSGRSIAAYRARAWQGLALSAAKPATTTFDVQDMHARRRPRSSQ
jgi:hypothetical protein